LVIKMNPQMTFLEIGASDFETLLPLSAQGWRGFIVEPIALYASYLKDHAQREGLDVEIIEAAITTCDGIVEMYECLDRSVQWKRGMSHMVNQSGTKLLELAGNRHIERKTISVEGIRLDTLIESLKLKHIDFLKMDIEGHEADVIDDYSWSVKPRLIKMEHKHIDDYRMKKILEAQGYTVWVESEDLYAIR
jgi:FkbM family methyltransferase